MAEAAEKPIADSAWREARILAGAAAGLFAAFGMAIAMTLVFYSVGEGFWFPLELISGLFFGVRVILGGIELVLLGLAIHLITGALLGIIFSVLVLPLETRRQAFWEGIVYSVMVWVVMSYIVLPLLNHTMSERIALVSGWWFLCHLVFGALLYVTPDLLRAFETRIRGELPVTPNRA
jgi:hypothetical protein